MLSGHCKNHFTCPVDTYSLIYLVFKIGFLLFITGVKNLEFPAFKNEMNPVVIF